MEKDETEMYLEVNHKIPVNKIAVTLHLVVCPRCLSLQIATQSAVAAVAAA